MCHTLFLSTTSTEDLSKLPKSRFSFEQVEKADECGLLEFPHRWMIFSEFGGCSCEFRHLMMCSGEPWFGPPEEWMDEDPDNVEATAGVYEVIVRLINEGHQVDVVDLWESKARDKVVTIPVSVSKLPTEDFRFFSDYRFVFQP